MPGEDDPPSEMSSGSGRAPGLEALLAEGIPPAALEIGRRWATPGAGREAGCLLVIGGDATTRAAYLRALAQDARSSGRQANLVSVPVLGDRGAPPRGAGALLVQAGDALADDVAAGDFLVANWEALVGGGLAISLTSAGAVNRLPRLLRDRLADAEVVSVEDEETEAAPATADEFGDFLADVSTVVAGLLDDDSAVADSGGDGHAWLGAPPPDRSLGDFVGLRGADSIGARVAREVLAAPGAGYNPLTVWAPPGTGKTTLLAAIARAYRERHPERTIAYLAPGHERADSGADLGRADLLVFDDIDGMVGLEAISNLVATLVADHRQVIVSCSAPPDALDLPRPLDALLRAGVVVGIGEVDDGREDKGSDASATAAALLAANDCADWIALDERIIEEVV